MSVEINKVAAGSGANDRIVKTPAKTMTNGDALFAVHGDIQILSLVSECYTDNDATASTLRYSVTTSRGQTQTISNASTSLANKAAGATVALAAVSTLAENPIVSDSGVSINTASRGLRCPPGTINAVIGVGPTTGEWKHYLRYEPLDDGAYVTPAL